MTKSVTIPKPVDLKREVDEMRRAHAVALARGMVNAQMVGDPFIPENSDLLTRRACLYAAALAQREGVLPADASGYFASFDPQTATVTFSPDPEQDDLFDRPDALFRRQEAMYRPAGGKIEVTIPVHIMGFSPNAPALMAPTIEGE